MTAVTLELTPDLEVRIRREAARNGLDTQSYILSTLREKLTGARRSTVPGLTADEAALLREINRGLPQETWQRYSELKEKRQAETLTPEEHVELIALSDRVEEMNVRRMDNVVQLARLRQTSVDALMEDLGLKSPVYE